MRYERTNHGPSARGTRPRGVDIGRDRTPCPNRQAPRRADGSVPASFRERAQLAEDGIASGPRALDVTPADFVEHTLFLGGPCHVAASDDTQRKVLGTVPVDVTPREARRRPPAAPRAILRAGAT